MVDHIYQAGRADAQGPAQEVRQWLDLLERTHLVCAEVVMDTPEDRALHEQHVQQVRDITARLRDLMGVDTSTLDPFGAVQDRANAGVTERGSGV